MALRTAPARRSGFWPGGLGAVEPRPGNWLGWSCFAAAWRQPTVVARRRVVAEEERQQFVQHELRAA